MSDLNAELACSLACADEVFMRVAPAFLKEPARHLAAEVIQRDKADLLELLELLADGLEGNSKLNVQTGMMATFVDPQWFPKFRRALARHCNREVLPGVRLHGAVEEKPRLNEELRRHNP